MKIETMRVLHLVDGVPTIEDVPRDWIKCSVLFEYRPKEEFMRDGKVVRTNCEKTYSGMSLEVMENTMRKNKQIVNSQEWADLSGELNMWHTLKHYREQMSDPKISMSIGELIEILKTYNPNARISSLDDNLDFTKPEVKLINSRLKDHYLL